MSGGVAGAVALALGWLGWPPPAAWEATPLDLMLALEGRLALAGPGLPALGRAEFETLKTRLT